MVRAVWKKLYLKKNKEERTKTEGEERKEKRKEAKLEYGKKLMNRKINKLKLISLSYGKQAESNQIDPNT